MNQPTIRLPNKVAHHEIEGFDRSKSIGGTDISCICGVNPYDSAYTVWQKKRGEGEPFEDTRHTEWGRRHEAAIIEKISDEHPEWRNIYLPRASYPGVIQHAGITGMHASPDGFALTKDNETVILEAKHVDYFGGKNWGDSFSEEYPLHYRYQVQWYMHITGLNRAFLGALIGGNNYREYIVRRNDDTIAEMVRCATEFWKQVENNVPPIPTKAADKSSYLLDTRGDYTDELVPASPDHDTKVKEIKRIDEETVRLANKKLDIQNELKDFIKAKGVKGIKHDNWKATWSESTSSKIPSYKGYASHLEDGWTEAALAPIRAQHTKTTTSDRLTISHKKGGKK